MKGKKLGKKYPVTPDYQRGSITDEKKAQKIMEEVDKVVTPGLIRLHCSSKQGENKSKRR